MLWIAQKLWAHRSAIIFAIQVVSALRKSARDFTREYIQKKLERKLKRQIGIVLLELGLFGLAYLLNATSPSLANRIFASLVLWGVTLYNVSELVFTTIPELRALHRAMKGKVGYAMKYLLEISLVTELMQLNIVFLTICLGLGISSRTVVGYTFSYTKPWVELFRGAEKRRNSFLLPAVAPRGNYPKDLSLVGRDTKTKLITNDFA